MQTPQIDTQGQQIIKEFIIHKMVLLLDDAACLEKIKEDKKVLEKLAIEIIHPDLHPLISAIKCSKAIDHNQKQIKDGTLVCNYFNALAELFVESEVWSYYEKFARVKLPGYKFANYDYVTTALTLLDHNDWQEHKPSADVRQKIKEFYLNTILTLGLSGKDKVYNLNILRDELAITLSPQEEAELSQHIKQNIMLLVELIDQLRRTAFGTKLLPGDETNSTWKKDLPPTKSQKQPEPIELTEPEIKTEIEAEPELDQTVADDTADTKKKSLFGLFGKKD